MDTRRAETLEALSAYLQHQKTLLARTQADIERLKKLRAEVLASPERFVNRSNAQNNDSTSRPLKIEEQISELQDYHPIQSFPRNVNWEAFSSSDATPLRTLAIRTRIDHTQKSVPSTTQRSPLSFLQKFVKDARKVILDPIFENLSASADMIACSNSMIASNPHINLSSSNDPNHTPTLTLPSSLSDDENEEHRPGPIVQDLMADIRKRDRAYAKLRELKKRKINTNLLSGCKIGEEESNDVSVRHDVDDENAKADVSAQTPRTCVSMPLDDTLDQTGDPMDVDGAGARLLDLPRPRDPVVSQRDNVSRSSHTRNPPPKPQCQPLAALTEKPENKPASAPMSSQSLGKRSRDIAEINDTVCKSMSEPLSVSEVNAETDKNRSDTYKQAWSISEQHLLERLLEEIPDGERNRWAKISQAMGGRRTPRQVASRVQKYFEKLKRFGVGVDNKGKAKS